VRALASRHGAVLVFDECTAGFRKTLGGLHLHYGVEPDMAIFGKTLGNGYAINAVIGREAVMQAAQETFISSTFWTERIGPAAAVAALAAMREEDAPSRVDAIGIDVARRWSELARETGLRIETGGLPALGTFSVPDLDAVAVRTFVTQEMLKAGFLAGTAVYASVAHDAATLDRYTDRLRPIFRGLAQCETTADVLDRLTDGPAHSGFKRLT
jgi:glutamate-1-semialdehyde 2,1-aminomutase